MIRKTPRATPPLAAMMEDLAATPQDIATALHVSQSTVYRWLSVGNAPRAPSLALYWMTRWGLSELDAELWNAATVYRGLAESIERELWTMRQHMQKLGCIGQYDSANDPVPGIARRFEFMDRSSVEPAWTHRPRQNPQAGPVMSGADVQAGHLKTGPT